MLMSEGAPRFMRIAARSPAPPGGWRLVGGGIDPSLADRASERRAEGSATGPLARKGAYPIYSRRSAGLRTVQVDARIAGKDSGRNGDMIRQRQEPRLPSIGELPGRELLGPALRTTPGSTLAPDAASRPEARPEARQRTNISGDRSRRDQVLAPLDMARTWRGAEAHRLRFSERLERLTRVVQELSQARDFETIVDIVRQAARALIGSQGATLVLRDGDFCHYVDEDAIAPLWKGKRFPMSACISGWVMMERCPTAIEDIYSDPRIP